MEIDRIFITYSVNKLRQLEGRIYDCVARLTPEQIWSRDAEAQNAVGNLMLHLSGNVTQWIVSSIGGAEDKRDRDAEFNAREGFSAAELKHHVQSAMDLAIPVIENVTAQRLTETIHVQNYDVTVLEAIYHVVEHFAEHTAQIIYATKLFTKRELEYYTHLKTPKHKETTP